jgi:branched-subunit amino acid transport protein
MTLTNELLLILGMALVTFGVRYPVLALLGRISLPEWVMRGLRYVPTAVLSAIVIPELIIGSDNALNISLSNAYLVAGIFSIAVAAFTKKLLPTIIAGMIFFLLWRTLLPAV